MANSAYGPGAFFKTTMTAAARLDSKKEKRDALRANPASITADKRKAKAAEERHRLKIKRGVWKRSSFCEFCGDSEAQTATKSPVATHEMHEVVFRSKTANMEPDARFSLANCARVCRPCHDDIHGPKKLKPFFHNDDLGMRGDYDVIYRDGLVIRSMRRRDLSKLNESSEGADL